jgi:ketosteroid isomerase-like protein
MSSPAQQPERQGTPPEKPSKVGPQKAYAFIYAPGPQWLAGRHGQVFRAAWDRFQPHEARGPDPQIVADADHVVVLRRHQVENAETGDRLDLPAVSVYRVENAKIANSRMFHFDAAALLRFLERNVAGPASHLPRGVR